MEAGQAIGIVGGDAYGRGSEARLSIYYYKDNVANYVPLQFWTKRNGKALLKHGGEYTCEKPVDIVQQEVKKAPAVKKTLKVKGKH